jgi:hypothetical protein
MKNWKSTLFGGITAAGIGMAQSGDGIVQTIGQVLSVIGPILLGLFAKDANVTGGTVVQPSTEAAKAEVLNPTAQEPKTERDTK